MAKVEIVGVDDVGKVEAGDFFIIDGDVIIVCALCDGNYMLFSISDGMRWDNESFDRSYSVSEVVEYIKDSLCDEILDDDIKFIKSSDCDIKIQVKQG